MTPAVVQPQGFPDGRGLTGTFARRRDRVSPAGLDFGEAPSPANGQPHQLPFRLCRQGRAAQGGEQGGHANCPQRRLGQECGGRLHHFRRAVIWQEPRRLSRFPKNPGIIVGHGLVQATTHFSKGRHLFKDTKIPLRIHLMNNNRRIGQLMLIGSHF